MSNRMIFWVLATGWAAAVSSRASSDLPRYRFQPGQEMVYSNSTDFQSASGEIKDSDLTTFWVVRQNQDGSWHLLYSNEQDLNRSGDSGHQDSTTRFGSIDVFADGRKPEKRTKLPEDSIPSVFPLLPADAAQVANGWLAVESEAVQCVCRVITSPRSAAGSWVFSSTQQGIFHDIYLMAADKTIHFDGQRGLVERIEAQTRQGYGFVGHGKDLTELKSVSTRGSGWMAQLATDAETLDAAEAAARAAVGSLGNGTNAQSAKAGARQALEAARLRVKTPAVQARLQSLLGNLDKRFQHAQQENGKQQSVLNQPAATWYTTDLDGHLYSLADYRGKVVALDFWYRGCGWCLRAMPQIKALADDFRGKPVVILGLNTDKNNKDARFVMDKMQLNYPTLHGEGIPEKYGVQGFPSLVVIDQKGIVRARHVGYSPTLREELARTIEGLLAGSPDK